MRKPIVAATAVVACLTMTSAAGAVVVDCQGLQAALGSATAGSTVTLAAGEFCPGEYQPAEVDITIEGELVGGAPAAGFQPGGATDGRSLFVDSHSATTTIRNLVFRGGDAGDGGLFVNGDGGSLILRGLVFDGVRASDSGGGLRVFLDGDVTLADSTFTGNESPLSGGGARIDARTALVSGSTFTGNEAGRHGGGLALTVQTHRDQQTAVAPGTDAELAGNEFTGNVAGAATATTARGGGLIAGKSGDGFDDAANSGEDAGGARPVLRLTGDRFQGNTVAAQPRTRTGAGVELYGVDATLDTERIVGNEVLGAAQPDVRNGGRGGGISLNGGDFRGAELLLRNSAVAANGVGAGGSGGGLRTSCLDCGTVARVVHSTISGNRTGAGGDGSGIHGTGFGSLSIVNSIVFGNVVSGREGTDVEGLEGWTAVNSDVCDVPQTDVDLFGAADENGNICEDPLLADAAGTGDVHQTAASPTIDAAPAPPPGDRVSADIDGDARPMLLTGRSGTPYDMGADERATADYGVTLAATPDPVKSGEPYTLVAKVTNAGPSAARGVMLALGLGGATLVSATPEHGSCGGSVTCELGDVAAGSSRSVTLVLKASAPAGRADVKITHTATVASTTPDPTAGDHSASRTVTVQGPGPAATVVPPPAAGGAAPAAIARTACGSRRFFTIRVRRRRDPVVSATIRLDGKRVNVRRRRGRLVATIDMLFQPKRTVTVTIRGRTRSGRRVSGKRVYHPCEGKRPHTIPDL